MVLNLSRNCLKSRSLHVYTATSMGRTSTIAAQNRNSILVERLQNGFEIEIERRNAESRHRWRRQ